MQSEASIRLRGEEVAILRVAALSGRQAIDGATLEFHCELTGRTSGNVIRFSGLLGRVQLEPGGDLGPVWLLNPFFLDTTSRDDRASATVCVGASDVVLRRIDQSRAASHSNELRFRLCLYLRGQSDLALVECQALAKYTVSGSEWFDALKTARYEARHLIDVPVEHGRVAGPLAEAASHYRSALEQWRKGSYVQVLTECRKVHESLRSALALKPAGITEWDPKAKIEWSLSRRIEYARAAVTEMLHLSAHAGTSDDLGPNEAELALGLTGTLLRYYAER